MNNLFLTNSLSNKKEIFKPLNIQKISLYACGPTVYDSPHVGNARALVIFDLLFRILIEVYGKQNVIYVRMDFQDTDAILKEVIAKMGFHHLMEIHVKNVMMVGQVRFVIKNVLKTVNVILLY